MDDTLRFGHWEVHPALRQLRVDGKPAAVGARAFDLLLTLIAQRDRVVSKHELLDAVWPDLVVEDNNLPVQIGTLRKVLGPQVIATVPGRGYRLSATPEGESTVEARSAPSFMPSARGNLPEMVSPLHGRDDDVTELQTLVQRHRILSVVGSGGVGKSRLAQTVAHAMRETFADGVWMIELAPVADPALVPAVVAHALGLALRGSTGAHAELIDALRSRELLLVLDNCEHLVEPLSAFAQALFERCAHVHLLTTTQQRLRLDGERVFRLAPLALPAAPDLASARASCALALFAERVAAQQRNFELGEHNVGDAVEICRQVDGLPLAIELAAGRVPLLGVAGVRERLHERFRVLSGGKHGAPRRQQALRETMDWSYGLLQADERAVFRRAGVFAGSFSLPAAQQALADERIDKWAVLDHLGALVDKSLLVVEPAEPPRYRLLESARAYALLKLHEAGESEATQRRHAQAVLAVFETSWTARLTAPTHVRVQLGLLDIDNLRAALDWSEQTDLHLYVGLVGASAWLWARGGQLAEGLRRLEQALAKIDEAMPAGLEARLQLGWSMLVRLRGGGAASRAAAERAAILYRALRDEQGLFSTLSALAMQAAGDGDVAVSEQALSEAEQLYDERWMPTARLPLLITRRTLLQTSGQYEEAHELCQQAHRIALESGDVVATLGTLMGLEQSAAMQDHFVEAVDRGREALVWCRREPIVASGVMVGNVLINLCDALTHLGQLDGALSTARESVALQIKAGTLWITFDTLGLLAFKRGRITEAARVLGRAEQINAWNTGGRSFGPLARRQREQLLQLLQQALPEAALAHLLAEGAELSDEQVARLAVDEPDETLARSAGAD